MSLKERLQAWRKRAKFDALWDTKEKKLVRLGKVPSGNLTAQSNHRMDVQEFQKACLELVKDTMGSETWPKGKNTGSRIERWKDELTSSFAGLMEKLLPKDKVFKTGIDIIFLHGNFAVEKTSTTLNSPEDDYYITFLHRTRGSVVIIVSITAHCCTTIG